MTGDDSLKINAVFIPKLKLKNYKISVPYNCRKYTITVFLAVAVVFGVIIFSINKNNGNVIGDFSQSFADFLVALQNKSKPQLFVLFFKNIILYVFLVLLFAFSAIGNILIAILSFINFAGIGAYIAFIYTNYGIAGIRYVFAVYIPGKIIFVTALLILIDICTRISADYRAKNRLSYSEIRGTVISLAVVFLMIIISLSVDLLAVDLFLSLTGIISFLG